MTVAVWQISVKKKFDIKAAGHGVNSNYYWTEKEQQTELDNGTLTCENLKTEKCFSFIMNH